MLGFGVQGFRVQGFRVQGSRVQSSGSRVLGCRASNGLEFEKFRIFTVWGSLRGAGF